jgi:hypothetical protein
MKTFLLACCTAATILSLPVARGQGTTFTYQGHLHALGGPADGWFDFQATVFDAETNGLQVGGIWHVDGVSVTRGLVTLTMDFGPDVFTGTNRWLEISVRTNGGASLEVLSPRQQVSATPYALTAGKLAGAMPASQLTGALVSEQLVGTYSQRVTLDNAGNAFAGDGSGLFGVTAAAVHGTLTNDTTGNAATATVAGTAASALSAGMATNATLADFAVAATLADSALVAQVAAGAVAALQLTNPVVTGVMSNILTVADPAPTGTNAVATIAHGSLWLASAHHSDVFDNYWSGGIVWSGEGWDGTPVPPDSDWTPDAKLQFFHTWGGPNTPGALLLTGPNLRFEQGGDGSGYGYVQLGNEDAVGNVDINFTTYRSGGATNVLSHPLSFTAMMTNEYYHPGIFARPAYPPVGDIQSYRAGELHFSANSPTYDYWTGYDGNNEDWTIMIMRTNAVEATVAVGIASNTPARWPSAPPTPGCAMFVNSNGVVFLLTSGTGMTWTATNQIAPPP